ncbi:MAG TPA: nucleotidyltransferase [Candidatus Omnitrophota bacterium]|nr:nucleotidyltransferase [Candidatus Omnitrophota bacterium]
MDIENLLKSLKEHKVKFVLIGAMAFPRYGYSRTTLDTDIFIEPTEKNADRTLKALRKFGYDVSDITVADLLSNKLLIRQYMVETDIHPFVTGVTFDEIWKNKKPGEIGDIKVYFPSLKDLIKMKKAAGRSKDKEDLKILKKLKG